MTEPLHEPIEDATGHEGELYKTPLPEDEYPDPPQDPVDLGEDD